MDAASQKYLERNKKLKDIKQPWLPIFDLIAEYVLGRKYPFNVDASTNLNAPFLLDDIFDKTAGDACRLASSCLVGGLWPNGARSFYLDSPSHNSGDELDDDEKKYYEWSTRVVVGVMDHPNANLRPVLEEYMGDQLGFGISGVAGFEEEKDYEAPMRYSAVDVKRISIDEGGDGWVDTVYNELDMTIRQAAQKYGVENLSPAWQKRLNGDKDARVKILHAIEPRKDVADPLSERAQDMPIASIHIEIETGHIIKESGFTEMPIFVSRFWKTMGEIYGRSPAMEAMPDILEINAMREAAEIAVEKSLDPPLAVYDDGGLGGGTINTSAGAINVRTVSGRLGNQKPIEPLYTVGELNTTYARITELKENIKNSFFVDRLVDLNNEQRMTAFETSVRDGLRGQTLNSVYARQYAEMFSRLINLTFNVCLKRGLLGVIKGSKEESALLAAGQEPVYIPDGIAARMVGGHDIYKIVYISPAALIMQNAELVGIQKMIEFFQVLAPLKPTLMDNVDEDATARLMQRLTGAPPEMLKSQQMVTQGRQQQQQMQQKMMEEEAKRNNSETNRNNAQAGAQAQAAGLLNQDDGSGQEQAA